MLRGAISIVFFTSVLLMTACDGSSPDNGAAASPSATASTDTSASPLVAISLDQSSIALGFGANLSWSASNASSCVASGGWIGSKGMAGSERVSPSEPGEMTYTITCSGPGGNSTASATLSSYTELSRRMISVAAIDESDVPYGGVVAMGALPSDGVGAAINATSRADTAKGGSAFIEIQTTEKPSGFMVGVEGISGSASYYIIDLAKQSAQVSTTASGEKVIVDSISHASTVLSQKRQAYIASKQGVSKALDSAGASYNYSLLMTFDANTPEDQVVVSVVAVYPVANQATSASSNNIDIKKIQSLSSRAAPPSTSRSPMTSSTIKFSTTSQSSNGLAITLNWTALVDLDLHVLTPSGSEIGYDNKTADGGVLDLDAYPNCNAPEGHTEHITWNGVEPLPHVYTIRPNYYASCGVTSPVRYSVTILNSGVSVPHYGVFLPAEANEDAGTDAGKLLYTARLPPVNGDAGLIARLLMAEVKSPAYVDSYDEVSSEKAMRALRSILENRKRSPSLFMANNSSVSSIVTAEGQFEGFSGGVSASIIDRINKLCNPVGGTASFKTYWGNVFTVSEAATVVDPYSNVSKIGDVNVEPGTWGVRTTGSGSPGSNFVLLPGASDLGGQSFFSLKKGLIK